MVFQLHPQAYRFAEGDVAKLELLPSDGPYARPSNAQAPIEVSNLELRLPVLEQPGSLGGLVQAPAPKVLPPGYQPAIDYAAPGETEPGGEEKGAAPTGTRGAAGLAPGGIRATRKALLLRVHCAGPAFCGGSIAASRKPGGQALAAGNYSLNSEATLQIRLLLTAAGRKAVAAQRRHHHKAFDAHIAFNDSGRGLFELTRPIHLPRG
jgi:hypothetical protein